MSTFRDGITGTAKRGVRSVKRRLRRAFGRGASKPAYVHPWTREDPGTPAVVDELDPRHCCGCGSCACTCPKHAICMQPDSEGFLYPQVDADACVGCGLCVRHCPVLVEQPENDVVMTCHAQLSDDDTRAQSSSGGMFTELARYAFSRGGVVFGAAYDDALTVRFAAARNEEELAPLRGTKYVQAQTGACYAQVAELLAQGTFVLFAGCPCQVAGLYAYLGTSDDANLLTVDLLCHGSPSPALFERYVDETYGTGTVADVRFRDKSAFGWSSHVNVYLADGSIVRTLGTDDPYFRMFSACLANRPFCSVCKFARLPRVGDVTIGDWWGIGVYDRSLDDKLGTSYVTLNNARARELYARLEPAFKRSEVYDIAKARRRNGAIDHALPAHQERARFFHLLELMPFAKAVRYTLDYRFDVGVFGLWYGENYGSILTYFGLVNVLESMGLSVCLIANPLGTDHGDTREPTAFARRQGFFISARRPLSKMRECNRFCDTFMVGSDQLWNPGLSGPYGHSYFLSFVADDKKRIAYGTSFGKGDHAISPRYKERSRWELSKFDALSVRDDFSKRLLAEDYGCASTKVLDPALLCDPQRYVELAATATQPLAVAGTLPPLAAGGYTLAYLLDPDENTAEELAHLARLLGNPVVVALDMAPHKVADNQALFAGSHKRDVYVLDRPHVEQWLFCFAHARNVLTDSFHGTLFSHVFGRDFVALPNARRGAARFTDALGVLGLRERIVERLDGEGGMQAVAELLATPVDFAASNERLQREREASYAWLSDALFSPKRVATDCVYERRAQPAGAGQRQEEGRA